jgi:hypothetical protein
MHTQMQRMQQMRIRVWTTMKRQMLKRLVMRLPLVKLLRYALELHTQLPGMYVYMQVVRMLNVL